MKFLILFVAWCILLVLSWPVALLVLLLAPLVWLHLQRRRRAAALK